MKKALIVVLFCLTVLSCGGDEGAIRSTPSPALPYPSPSPTPCFWPIQRHPSMEEWDTTHAAWMQAWRAAPTAPPLAPDPLSVDEALNLAERMSERIPPTPLPRPFQTPKGVEMVPVYGDPFQGVAAQGEQGMRMVFLADDVIMKRIYWLHPGESFAGLMFLGHYVYPPPEERAHGEDFRFFCLLDYDQIPFLLDGVEAVVHDFHLGPNEERVFRLEFPDLVKGFHHLICLYYTDPDAFPQTWDQDDYDSWFLLSGANGSGPSGLLLVGEENPPEVSYTHLPGSLPTTPNLHGALIVNRSAAEEDAWRSWMPATWEGGEVAEWGPVEAAPGELLEPVLRANNPDSEPFRFGVAAFLDYRQIPLRLGDSDLVSWYELDPGRQEIIPLSFVAPEEPGPHSYFILKFQAPYEPIVLYEWVGDSVRFPWVSVRDVLGPQVLALPNMRYESPFSSLFERTAILVLSERR